MAPSIQRLESAHIPTQYGAYKMLAYDSGFPDFPHLALEAIPEGADVVDIRIHSECMTGDVFGSVRCDCGEQLTASMRHFEENGGLLLYLRQEGRGIGLINKMKAYNLQDKGMDTVKANHALGFATDLRDFSVAISILNDLGIKRVRLLTNNPEKVKAFEDSGIEVVERLPLSIPAGTHNKTYLATKQNDLGHLLG